MRHNTVQAIADYWRAPLPLYEVEEIDPEEINIYPPSQDNADRLAAAREAIRLEGIDMIDLAILEE